MHGSDRRVPFVIGKSKKPRCFQGYVPVRYRHNAKAWMTCDLFVEWLREFDQDMLKQDRRVLLVVENCSTYHVQASLTRAVTLLFLPPNTTSKVQPLELGIICAFKSYYRHRVVERLLIAVDRPAANLPLRVTLYSALEMLKASWIEVTATCVQNCFCKAGFIDAGPNAEPENPKEDRSTNWWQRVVDSDLRELDISWDDFITADDDADTAEPSTDEGIVNEVRGKSDTEESYDDKTLEPATTSVLVAIDYIDSLRQLVYAKNLSEEHAAALTKLETVLITSALSKQTCITDFFAKTKVRLVMDTTPNSDATPNPTAPDLVVATLRLPEFWQADSKLWFLSIEPLFRRHQVTSQTARYNYVIGALPPAVNTIIKDILRSPPPDNPYDTLNDERICWTTESEQHRLQQLLT
nr:LOW QUALITY PROTEIN: tigger transposable element-derived protein 6-like [Rhipicephalus microplus]